MVTLITEYDRAFLIHAFREAAAAALADDGTNTLAIRLPSLRAEFVEECAAEAGVRVSLFAFHGRRWFLVHVHGAEAACRRLKKLGLQATVYRQAD